MLKKISNCLYPVSVDERNDTKKENVESFKHTFV